MRRAERAALRGLLALLAAIGALLLATPPPALQACGPSFPNQLLLNARGAALSAPAADFGRELARIAERHEQETPSTSDALQAAYHRPYHRRRPAEERILPAPRPSKSATRGPGILRRTGTTPRARARGARCVGPGQGD